VLDLLIVGGGPAGLATGILAREKGLSVVVAERRPEGPVDKACGEGLMPDGVAALERLGVAVEEVGGAPFSGIRYVDGVAVAEGEFPGRPGLGVRRTRLHAALVERAASAGVEVRWGWRLEGLEHRQGPLGGTFTARVAAGDGPGEPLPARWVVGADGLLSGVRRQARLEGPAARRMRFGVRRHFEVAPRRAGALLDDQGAALPDKVEVWWGDRCEAYVTPVAADEVGVAILWGGRKASFDELLAGFPRLAAALAGCPPRSRDRGAGPLRQRVRGVVRGNLALVGDASGYVDAITGEGLSLAFRQAEALAAALAAGDLGRYAADHRRACRVPDAMTRLLLAVERRPRLRRRTVRALAADPSLFSCLLALHVGAIPPSALGWPTAARLLRGLVSA
jgi:flavin-dependent dehydrogenase